MYTGQLSPIAPGETWIETFELRSDDDGELVDLTGRTIEVEVRRSGCTTAVLEASTGNGNITTPADGIFQFRFENTETDVLCSGLYRLIIDITYNDETDRLVDCFVPVIGD